MLSTETNCIEIDKDRGLDTEVCNIEKAVKDEERRNDTSCEKFYHTKEENEKERQSCPREFREEDLKNLLLHYMKLTLKLRRKNSGDSGQASQDALNYSASTDYDSEDEPTCRKSSTPPILKCKHCSKLLRGAHSLKNHFRRKHGNHSKDVLCDKCPTRFYTEFEFNRHYQTHYSIKNYLCHLCSKKFFQKSSLVLHLRYHENDRRYQCETCRKKFFTSNHLKRHSLVHTNRRDFQCEPCGRSFRYKDHLHRHLQSVHIGVRSHNCRACDKSFMFLSQLKFHEHSHKETTLKCSNCKETFEKRISLEVHQKECKK